MKELKDGELIDLAYDEIRKMDIHIWSTIVITALMFTESVFLILNMIPIIAYGLIWLILMVVYLVHRKKITNSEKKIEEILKELTSRES
jgi:hypothetical protein